MRAFARDELTRFLQAVDGLLAAHVDLVLLGDAAIALHFSAAHAATRIVAVAMSDALTVATARVQVAFAIPVALAGTFAAPYDYEDRVERVGLAQLSKLRVWVPERHDLAVMLLARGELQAVEAVHRAAPLDAKMLIARTKQTPVPGSRVDFETALGQLLAVLKGGA